MNAARKEVTTIVASMVMTCAVGAAVLGVVYLVTSAHTEAAQRASEQREVAALLALGPQAEVLEVRQLLAPERRVVIYQVAAAGSEAKPAELAFDLDGMPVPPAPGPGAAAEKLVPLGRVFVARQGGLPAGFVVEGTTRGYKNRIRFLVGLDARFEIAGVRVVEHEEDPGLGAEVATRQFTGQFVGRTAEGAALAVTRDPMPEDWRAALSELRRMAVAPWRGRHQDLLARERGKPIYAVTGATISSRALADGVRVTVERFRTRWQRLAPYLDRLAAGGTR
jgi:H+/Na+-translocating ferredoxin:NAD+ oxidoreductase subunit G